VLDCYTASSIVLHRFSPSASAKTPLVGPQLLIFTRRLCLASGRCSFSKILRTAPNEKSPQPPDQSASCRPLPDEPAQSGNGDWSAACGVLWGGVCLEWLHASAVSIGVADQKDKGRALSQMKTGRPGSVPDGRYRGGVAVKRSHHRERRASPPVGPAASRRSARRRAPARSSLTTPQRANPAG
jgi:hypothetical protein